MTLRSSLRAREAAKGLVPCSASCAVLVRAGTRCDLHQPRLVQCPGCGIEYFDSHRHQCIDSDPALKRALDGAHLAHQLGTVQPVVEQMLQPVLAELKALREAVTELRSERNHN